MTDMRVAPLRGFAAFLRQERTTLTEKWMRAVAGDTDLVEADKLTREQLADHLPEILDGICAALEAQDLEPVERAIERDARIHGKVRWRQGYRIDELVHVLELFRQAGTSRVASDETGRPDRYRRAKESRHRKRSNVVSTAFCELTTAPLT
ncbi:RsbRD N-terminal domain-containing protein [Paraburkholderia strydomiana]|nr:RsbRD N-terminal domain-containing protein [Paraburkholderia strydomiana]